MSEENGYELLRVSDLIGLLKSKLAKAEAKQEEASNQIGKAILNGYTGEHQTREAQQYKSNASGYREQIYQLERLANEFCSTKAAE